LGITKVFLQTQGREIQIQIQIPMGRPLLPRRRGRRAWAAVIEKAVMAKTPAGAICAKMCSPSQKLVAKPLPLSKKRNKCAVSGTIFPGVRYIKFY
jgi:hypothetical protein